MKQVSFKLAIIVVCLLLTNCNRYNEPIANPLRTGCYWEWMNGNISNQGITRDLEYMKKAGIESALIFDTHIGIQRGPVDYGSKEWIEAVKWACHEAKRLGIVLGIHNSPGYSAVGGRWIKPEESMKQITWSVADNPNPPVPSHKMGFYRDLFVQPLNSADEMQSLTLRLEGNGQTVVTLQSIKPVVGFNIWRGERETPLDPFDGPRDYAPRLRVEISTDSVAWHELGFASGPALKARDIPIHFDCKASSGRYLRLTSNRGTNLDRIEILTSEGSGKAWRRVGYTTNGQMTTAACESGMGLEVDKLSRQGIEAHLNGFLIPLLDELKEYCGNTLKYVEVDSWEAGGQDWTESLGIDYLQSGEGKDFVNGALYSNTTAKQELFMSEFVEPLKEALHKYNLLLIGEPYGNGDFDARVYGMAVDIPMSEYWARCHYGDINRPIRVTEYGLEAGREMIGCEVFTAYPGDADIEPVLSNFKEDIDKLCEVGVNYFVLHCVTHQNDDSYPLTMGPFGTRFDRLHANADSVRAITDYIRQRIDLQ